MKNKMEIKCCGKEITEVEEGVNGSDYYECLECGTSYNVLISKVKD